MRFIGRFPLSASQLFDTFELSMAIQTIIFDLDGTLIDTEMAASQAVTLTFAKWNIQLGKEDAAFITGRKWEVAFDYLFQKYPISMPRREAESEILRNYRRSLDSHLRVIPGSPQAVKALAASYELGLVSGSSRREIRWALEKLKIIDHFKVLLGAEDYGESKPSPEGYLKAIKEMKCKPEQALVFEDSNAGIASGRAAGTWVVAITAANHFDHDVSHAHERIVDFTGVDCDWVAGFGKRKKLV